jgi:hypothetical protein
VGDGNVAEVEMSPIQQSHSNGGPRRERQPTATVTVTIRMPVTMVDALKSEAQLQGVRGYQTLLKRWIEERLDGDRLLAARRLEPVLRSLQDVEGELRRLIADAPPDH